MLLTISDATGSSRFTTFTIDESNDQFVTSVENILNDAEVKTFRLEGSGLIDAFDDLKNVSIISRDFLNGQPLISFGQAEKQAASLGSGELVTITADSGSCTDKAETGVFVLTFSDNGGHHNHLAVITFYPADKLWLNVGSTTQSILEAA